MAQRNLELGAEGGWVLALLVSVQRRCEGRERIDREERRGERG